MERFGTWERPLRIAVIGAGPSGFYTIKLSTRWEPRPIAVWATNEGDNAAGDDGDYPQKRAI